MNFRRSKFFIRLFASFALAGGFFHYSYGRETSTVPTPSSLAGTWQVIGVHIDTGASRTPMYQHDDLRLTGRLFTITPESIETNTPEDKLCSAPKFKVNRMKAANLLKSSMAGRIQAPEAPSVKDYQLALKEDAMVDALTIDCKEGRFAASLGRDGGLSGAWMLVLQNNQLAIRWYDETILLLKRLANNAKPQPSFLCGKAGTSVEKNICGSVALANFDQSIALSYAEAQKQFNKAQNRTMLNLLKTQQKEWLEKRNACNADAHCLQSAMAARLQVIETMAP